jgi:hypothetical protein
MFGFPLQAESVRDSGDQLSLPFDPLTGDAALSEHTEVYTWQNE